MAQLLKSPLGSSTRYLIDEVMGKDGIDHLFGDVLLSRTGRGIVVKGSIKANTTNNLAYSAEYVPKIVIVIDLR